MVSITSILLIVGLLFRRSSAQKIHREKQRTVFVEGNLGTVSTGTGMSLLPEDEKAAATFALMDLLVKFVNATGIEDVRATDDDVVVDMAAKNRHVRFQQYVDGLPLQRATLMLHIRGDTVFAFNGEFTPDDRIVKDMELDCDGAMAIALTQLSNESGEAEPTSLCLAAAVRGDDGIAHKGYQQSFSFRKGGSFILFASGKTGALVAMNRLSSFARSITTRNWYQTNTRSRVVSTSPNPIRTGIDRFDGAHNFTLLTYNFFLERYGRDSIDGKGLPLVVNVDYIQYPNETDNAYYDSEAKQVFVAPARILYSFATSLDVISHEWTHGFTAHTSKLGDCNEPGALNEGMSEVFAMAIGRFQGKQSISNTLITGEGLQRRSGGPSFAVNYRNPGRDEAVDFYPDFIVVPRTECKKVVHPNSGVMSLAFVLMTIGGRHPRNKTNIAVTPMDPNFDKSMLAALDVFYWSNVACLTPNSGYQSLRKCTEMFSKSARQTKTIRDSWAAVGVGCIRANLPCPGSLHCCHSMVCRKKNATQTSRACYNCAVELETCFADADCCSPKSYKCVAVAAGSTRKVCKKV